MVAKIPWQARRRAANDDRASMVLLLWGAKIPAEHSEVALSDQPQGRNHCGSDSDSGADNPFDQAELKSSKVASYVGA